MGQGAVPKTAGVGEGTLPRRVFAGQVENHVRPVRRDARSVAQVIVSPGVRAFTRDAVAVGLDHLRKVRPTQGLVAQVRCENEDTAGSEETMLSSSELSRHVHLQDKIDKLSPMSSTQRAAIELHVIQCLGSQ